MWETIGFMIKSYELIALFRIIAIKTYYPQIKILERNAHIKKTAVKLTAEILIKARNSSSFPES